MRSATRPRGELREIAAAVREAGRSREPDRYLAALLAPPAARVDLAAVAAFSAELRKSAESVSEPLVAQIRLQWWRDALAGLAAGEASGHPVGDAMAEAVRVHALPWALLDELIDACEAALLAHTGAPGLGDQGEELEAILFRLGMMITGIAPDQEAEAAILAAGRVYGIARRLGSRSSQGRGAVGEAVELRTRARAELADARRLANGLDRRALPAFLPLVMVEPYLRVLERGDDAARRAAVLPVRRAWRIWRAHMRGRI